MDCSNEESRIKRSVDDPRMASDNVTKEKGPFMHLTDDLGMKALSSPVAVGVRKTLWSTIGLQVTSGRCDLF